MEADPQTPYVTIVDASYLETLVGYNAKRAALTVISEVKQRMTALDLRTTDFSVLSLIVHNAGITSRQLCSTLNILAPNLVAVVDNLEQRGLIARRPHPVDGRAMGLHPTSKAQTLMDEAEKTVRQLEIDATSRLSPAERKTLLLLLQKIYK